MKIELIMKNFFVALIAFLLLTAASGHVSEGETPPDQANPEIKNTHETLYKKAMGLDVTESPSWGYIAYNTTTQGSRQDIRMDPNGNVDAPEIPLEGEGPAGVEPPIHPSLIEEDIKRTAPLILEGEPEKPLLLPAAPPVNGKVTASSVKQDGKDYIVLNFDNAALKDVINTISSITGESFIVSPGLDARITIYSSGKIPTSEVLSVFESVLEVNNMALVKAGHFYKIVSINTAKQKPIEVQKGNEYESAPAKDRPVTRIVQVEYVPADEISKVLQPMLSSFGSIISNPRNNLLIINDTTSNLKRLLSILEEIDVNVFGNTRIGFFQPKYSDVSTLSEEIKEILAGLNLTKDGMAVIPIERINSLIIFSSSPSLLKIVEGWLKKLDEEVATGQNIFVYPVQNVKAESLIDVLRTIYEVQGGTSTSRTATQTAKSGRKTPARQARTARAQGASGSGGRVEIVIFEPTNSLVILAPPGLYLNIKETIKQLDIYPQEVLIEVIIAEVTLTESEQFGIQWSVLGEIGNDPDFTQRGTGFSTLGPVLPATPLTLGADVTGISYALFDTDKFLAMLHALAGKGKVHILQSPRLLVRNQEEASFEVGSDIPTATSTTTSATTLDNLTTNIEYRTVGIKLKIKPTINSEKTVVLDIEQEVSDTLPNVTVGQEGFTFPAFSTRKTKTSIIVPDKQGIIIAGIMTKKKDKNYQGIPVLSAIPLLGNLFRYTVNESTKTELVMILTPHVISNNSEGDILTQKFIDKLKAVKSFLQNHEDDTGVETGTDQNNEQ